MSNYYAPKVGMRLMRKMTISGMNSNDIREEPCTVVYVNKKHMWYTVKFDKTGIKESYKIPYIISEENELETFKNYYKTYFGKYPHGIYAIESGALYKTIEDCSLDLNVPIASIIRHIRGELSHIKGYHIHIFD